MQLIKRLSTPQIMRQVIYALIPVIIASLAIFGFGVIKQIVFAILTALIIDMIAEKIQGKKFGYFINDYSSILTALLLAISIPTIAPLWVIIIGVSFALIFAKYAYGGLGNNIFNPAMVGYVFLLISYPAQMASWQSLDIFISFNDLFSLGSNIDAISSATMLDSMRNNLPFIENNNNLFIIFAAIIGGIYLIFKKIISWHIPFAVTIASIFTLILISIFNNISLDLMQLFAGGFFFAIFFIATDPVSTCATNKGRIIFGIMVGFLLIIIRTFGNYPDGIAFAILIANMFVPLIDYYIKK